MMIVLESDRIFVVELNVLLIDALVYFAFSPKLLCTLAETPSVIVCRLFVVVCKIDLHAFKNALKLALAL